MCNPDYLQPNWTFADFKRHGNNLCQDRGSLFPPCSCLSISRLPFPLTSFFFSFSFSALVPHFLPFPHRKNPPYAIENRYSYRGEVRRECHSRVPSSQSAVTVAPAHMMDGVVFNASLVEMFESVVEKGTLSHEGCVKKTRVHTHTHTRIRR